MAGAGKLFVLFAPFAALGCTKGVDVLERRTLLNDASPLDAGEPRGDFVDIEAGDGFACAITREGNLYCWGANTWGQLGGPPETETCVNQSAANRCIPSPHRVPRLERVKRVAVGSRTACAILDDETLHCWGSNAWYQLGVETAPHCNRDCSYTPIAQRVGPTENAVVGHGFVCALTKAREVRCWGSSEYGQLGFDPGVPMTADAGSPAQPAGPVNSLAASTLSTACAVARNEVWCWGNNFYGHLGPNDAETGPVLVAGIPEASDVTVGETAAFAQTSQGLWSWASSGYGVRGGVSNRSPAKADPVWPAFVQISHRTRHALGLWEGAVFAWGDGSLGAIGAYSFDSDCNDCSRIPTRIGAIAGQVTKVSAGDSFSLALTTAGRVFGWGRNSVGQLGHPPGSQGDAQCGAMRAYCNPVPQEVRIVE